MTPLNRSLLVNIIEQEGEKQTSFFLPDDVITNKRPFEVVEVIDVSSESKFFNKLQSGDKIVVEGHMLRDITVFGSTATLIEENYVLAKL
jgi:co-chaperonin GroES (HSP10)